MEDGALPLQLNAYEMLHNECAHSRTHTHAPALTCALNGFSLECI